MVSRAHFSQGKATTNLYNQVHLRARLRQRRWLLQHYIARGEIYHRLKLKYISFLAVLDGVELEALPGTKLVWHAWVGRSALSTVRVFLHLEKALDVTLRVF